MAGNSRLPAFKLFTHHLGSLAILSGILALMFVAVACGSDSNTAATSTSSATNANSTLNGNITVFAASSLTDAFKAVGSAFEKANPGTKVSFNFAASSTLATQINEGAPADVFASADSAQMNVVADKGATGPQAIFATNVPVVVVPKDDDVVKSFADLAKSGVKLVLAAPDVPIGHYARQILTNASSASGGINPNFSATVVGNLVSNEANVRAVLAKIEVGEADAGIVYATDAAAAKGDTRTIAIPEKYNLIAQYPIAAIKTSKHVDIANDFVAFVLSNDGQAIMQQYGFGKPS